MIGPMACWGRRRSADRSLACVAIGAPDAEHIRQRVEDWNNRLHALYDMIGGWLPAGWTAREGAPVCMHEEIMREFRIHPKQLPTLELVNRTGDVATLEPRALWVIGCNGRVDLKRGNHHYLVVDLAENFETAHWQAARADRRGARDAVTRDWLVSVLQSFRNVFSHSVERSRSVGVPPPGLAIFTDLLRLRLPAKPLRIPWRCR